MVRRRSFVPEPLVPSSRCAGPGGSARRTTRDVPHDRDATRGRSEGRLPFGAASDFVREVGPQQEHPSGRSGRWRSVDPLRPHHSRRRDRAQPSADDGFHLHDGLVGLDLEQRLTAPDGLAHVHKPAQDLDRRTRGCQVGHSHRDFHGQLPRSIRPLTMAGLFPSPVNNDTRPPGNWLRLTSTMPDRSRLTPELQTIYRAPMNWLRSDTFSSLVPLRCIPFGPTLLISPR